jgi:hypothetical protein
MVTGNPCVPIEQSHRQHRDAHLYLPDSLLQLQNHWNDQYMKRSRRCPNVAICEKLFSNLSWTAPVVSNEDFIAAFGRIPGTQNPGNLQVSQMQLLLQRLGIPVPLSSP